jgi:hypothetical protein
MSNSRFQISDFKGDSRFEIQDSKRKKGPKSSVKPAFGVIARSGEEAEGDAAISHEASESLRFPAVTPEIASLRRRFAMTSPIFSILNWVPATSNLKLSNSYSFPLRGS